jgi:hypothetical protein
MEITVIGFSIFSLKLNSLVSVRPTNTFFQTRDEIFCSYVFQGVCSSYCFVVLHLLSSSQYWNSVGIRRKTPKVTGYVEHPQQALHATRTVLRIWGAGSLSPRDDTLELFPCRLRTSYKSQFIKIKQMVWDLKVLMAMTVKNTGLWDVTSYILADICRPFRRPWLLHLQSIRVCPEDGSSTFLRKVDKFLPAYTVSQS